MKLLPITAAVFNRTMIELKYDETALHCHIRGKLLQDDVAHDGAFKHRAMTFLHNSGERHVVPAVCCKAVLKFLLRGKKLLIYENEIVLFELGKKPYHKERVSSRDAY